MRGMRRGENKDFERERGESRRPELNLSEGAYIANAKGEIIGDRKTVKVGEYEREFLTFMLSNKEDRRGIAMIFNDNKVTVVVPLIYKEKERGRNVEGVGIFVSSRRYVLELLKLALGEIKDNVENVTGGFVRFDRSVREICEYIRQEQMRKGNDEVQKVIGYTVGYTLFKLACGDKPITNLWGIFTANIVNDVAIYACCSDYNPREVGWDFDIVANIASTSLEEEINSRLNDVYMGVIRRIRQNISKHELKSIVEQVLEEKKLIPYIFEFYYKTGDYKKLCETYKKYKEEGVISNKDIPLELKIKYDCFAITSRDLIEYMKKNCPNLEEFVNLFIRLPSKMITEELINEMKEFKDEVFIRNAVSKILNLKNGRIDREHLKLIKFVDDPNMYKRTIENFINAHVKELREALKEEGAPVQIRIYYPISLRVRFLFLSIWRRFFRRREEKIGMQSAHEIVGVSEKKLIKRN